MKRVLFSLAVLAAAVAPAEDVISSSNVLGLLPVTSSAKRVIVSVPWCAMSSVDDAAIQVSNVVKTANLTAGDMLYYVQSDGSQIAWRLSDTTPAYWESVIIASEDSVQVSNPAHNQTVARGGSIVLVRQNTGTFYLYGQVATSSSVETVITAGEAESPAYTMIASPTAAAWKINDPTWASVGANDRIFVPVPDPAKGSGVGLNAMLEWNGTKWCSRVNEFSNVGGQQIRTGTHLDEYTADIPAGQGVWYVSYGGAPTVIWTGAPSK